MHATTFWHAAFIALMILRPLASWRVVLRPCPPGCEGGKGNCNHELGVCECPVGWAGPGCEEAVLGACRSSNSSTAVPGYGLRWPKSCECWRQLTR